MADDPKQAGTSDADATIVASVANDGGFASQIAKAAAQHKKTLADVAAGDIPAAPIPTSIGSYKILRLLGEGGMGAVYEAQQVSPHRLVAIKVLRPGYLSPFAYKRFAFETEVLGRLQNPHIAAIYDAGIAETPLGPQPYFAMELVQGRPMTEYATEKKLGLKDRLELLAQISDAVHYAHQKGVIHRDLKPLNILVTTEGIPKILDFGLARSTETDVKRTSATEAGALMGTLLYMAPEQTTGNPDDIDTRTDVYALGVICYELLTGKHPLALQDRAIFAALQIIRDSEPTRLSIHDRTLRGDVETIVAKSLEKDKAQRYSSAAALAADIRRYLTDQPISARPASTFYQLSKFSRRHKALVGGVIAVFLVLIAGVVGTTYGLIGQKRETAKAEEQRQRAENLNTDLIAQKNSLQRQVYLGNMLFAQSAGKQNYLSALNDLLDKHAHPTANETDFRSFEWYYWWRFGHEEVATLKGLTLSVPAIAVRPDGKAVAAADADGALRAWDPATGTETIRLKTPTSGTIVWSIAYSPDGTKLAWAGADEAVHIGDAESAREKGKPLTGHKGDIKSVCFSPDSTHLATGGADKTIRIWDAQTGQTQATLQGHSDTVNSVTFSPDGKLLASASADTSIILWDVTTTKAIRTLKGHNGPVQSVTFSPDGKQLASGSKDRTVRLWDVATGQPVGNPMLQGTQVPSVSFSPDGKRLASSGDDIKIWEVATGRELDTIKGQPVGKIDQLAYPSVCFSPDGTRLIAGTNDGTVKVWDSVLGRATRTLAGAPDDAAVTSLAGSPDGKWLASGAYDGMVKIWEAATGHEARNFRAHNSGAVVSLTFSPDGKQLVTSSDDKTIKIWDASGGQLIRTLEGHPSWISRIAFSPDGAMLASAGRDSAIKIWNTQTGAEIRTLKAADRTDVTFSPNGKWIAGVGTRLGSQIIVIWDAQSGQEIKTLKVTMQVSDVTFSPDGKWLAASSNSDTDISVWDAASGDLKYTLKGHQKPVPAICFNKTGNRLASADKDNTVKLWDMDTGQETLTLTGRPGQSAEKSQFSSLCFSADGNRLSAGSQDGSIKVWDATPIAASK